MSEQIYKLKKPLEYGGEIINELRYDDDPDEMTPAQLADLDFEKITVVVEITKAIAAVTRQPVELIESLKMSDWGAMSRRIQGVLGNALNQTD